MMLRSSSFSRIKLETHHENHSEPELSTKISPGNTDHPRDFLRSGYRPHYSHSNALSPDFTDTKQSINHRRQYDVKEKFYFTRKVCVAVHEIQIVIAVRYLRMLEVKRASSALSIPVT